jgi:predicted RNase H-like nuclease
LQNARTLHTICLHQESATPITLSIRDVPDDIAERLRARAKQNHRSLQGELMAIVEQAAETSGLRDRQREYRVEPLEKSRMTIEELSKRAKERAIYQPGDETSAQMIRRDRDEGHGRKFVGLDGYKHGWVAVWICDSIDRIQYFRNIGEFLKCEFSQAMIDMPIGLPDRGNRECDLEAKSLLGKNAPRVFTGARRSILQFQSQAEATRFCKARGDAGVAQQLFCLGKKIREVDDVMTEQLQLQLMEAHPELVFWRLNGRKPLPSKKTQQGQELRRQLMKAQGFYELDKWLDERKGTGAAADDILDACACAVAARDHGHKVPAGPSPIDAKGLRMEINF